MIEITIYRKDINDGAPCYDRTSYICGYLAEGHSEDAVICAAVTTLGQMPIAGIRQCGFEPEYELNEKDGTIVIWTPEQLLKNPGVQLLFNTVQECLESIGNQYPNEVVVKEEACENEQESKI